MPGALAPPPMKIASGGGSRRARPALALRRLQAGHAEGSALRAMRSARSSRGSIATRACGGIGEHPFDGDRARAGAHVPQQFAAPRRERGQRHRADLALGDLPVVLEQSSASPARAAGCALGRGDDFERDRVQSGDVGESEARRLVVRMRSRGPPIASQHGEPRRPMPRAVRSAASFAGPSPSQESARMRAPGCRWGTDASSGRPCSETARSPAGSSRAAPRRGEGGGRRERPISSRRHAAHQHRADAEEERIAAGEHADGAAALRQHASEGAPRRRGPRQRLAADQRPGEGEMALPPNTKSACATRPRAAGIKPSIPSSPMPTRPSQRMRQSQAWPPQRAS